MPLTDSPYKILPPDQLRLDVVSLARLPPLLHNPLPLPRSEGYYLHRLLSNTFEEQHSISFILIFGWGQCGVFQYFSDCTFYFSGAPLLPTLLYTGVRIYYQDTLCWAQPSEQVETEGFN